MTDNSIFVGDKPFLNYVTGIVMQFTTKEEQQVLVKARGKYIARAVDVAEAAVKTFLSGKVRVEAVAIDSEDITSSEGLPVRVSTIEITLARA
jgi:DNA-binding protein